MGELKTFLKPNKPKIILFVILVFVSFQILANVSVPIFPCKTWVNAGNYYPPLDAMCDLIPMLGERSELSIIAGFELAILLLVIPYLIACKLVTCKFFRKLKSG